MTTDRVEAERQFIGAVLADNLILASANVAPVMFTKYRRVWERIEALAVGGTVGFSELYVGGADLDKALLGTLGDVFAANWEYHHKIIRDGWAQDVIGVACNVAKWQAYPESVDTLDKALTDVSLTETGSRTKSLAELLGPALEGVMSRRASGGVIPGIQFGMRSIDFATLGARDGQLIVIGGRPSGGKSAIGLQLARHIAPGTKQTWEEYKQIPVPEWKAKKYAKAQRK